jgi:hypothetical protein
LIDLFADYRAKVSIIYFETSAAEAHRRNAERERPRAGASHGPHARALGAAGSYGVPRFADLAHLTGVLVDFGRNSRT